MRRISCLTGCALAFFCMFLLASAASGGGLAGSAAARQTSTAAASAPTAASGTAATQGKIYFCTNQVILDQQNRKYKEFWSDVFASDAEQADLTNAWRVYLTATYQLNPNDGRQINGGCGETTATFTQGWKAGARQSWERTTKIEQDRVAAGSPGIVEEHTVVDTGWKYTPVTGSLTTSAPAVASGPARIVSSTAPAASRPGDPCFFNPHGLATAPPPGCGPAGEVSPTPPAAPVASAAVNPPPRPSNQPAASAVARPPAVSQTTLYAVCWDAALGMNNLTAYFGVPFTVTKRDNAVWTAAFKSFLNEKYGRASAGNVSCNVSPTLAAAQQNEEKWKGLYSKNRKIVETGWKFQ